jgi:hypothetical protein
MRKLLFVIAAVAVVLSSCTSRGIVRKTDASVYTDPERVDAVKPDESTRVRYKIVEGCRWLLFINQWGLSTEHSPKCENPECPYRQYRPYRNGTVQHDTVYFCNTAYVREE